MKTKGLVKWFNDKKGYGFITTAEGEAFVHHSQIRTAGYRTLMTALPVECELKKTDKGLHALNVTPLFAPAPAIFADETTISPL
jgi:CspA family cold shock protein